MAIFCFSILSEPVGPSSVCEAARLPNTPKYAESVLIMATR